MGGDVSLSAYRRFTRLAGLVLAAFISLALLYYISTTTSLNGHITRIAESLANLSHSSSSSNFEAPPAQSQSQQLRILLVSALFPLAKSKHSQSEYESWLKRFLGQISTEVYFFTSPSLSSVISSTRPPNYLITINTTFSAPFDIPPLRDFEQRYAQMYEQDRERLIHSPELYAVWNGKAYYVAEAIKNLEKEGKTYDYVFWNDAGSFRDDHLYKVWPDPENVRRIFEEGENKSDVGKDELVFFPLEGLPVFNLRSWTEDKGPIDMDMSEGSFFGGSPSAMQWWSATFYAYHDYYISLSCFVGKDQTLFNALFFLFPERFIAMYHGNVPYIDRGKYGACGDGWWYYHYWLGNEEGRKKEREVWLSELSSAWAWWKGKVPCTLAPVVPMKELLEKQFGREWTPPQRHLVLD
ncbi:hypothetical protein AX15_001855 [Amanita polypyramis BW_CC]|nr:hypothetical protein AX15_001855 [Amanita polypyramis BW_CC]